MEVKPTFLNQQNPILCAITECSDPESIISDMCNSFDDGADAFAIEMDHMNDDDKTLSKLRYIFSFAGRKPIYVTNYRQNKNSGKTDEELVAELLVALEAGATLIDVMGDLYDPHPLELSFDEKAVERQMKLIDLIHERGGEVLMSSHAKTFLEEAKVIEFALAQASRGADISKVVTWADDYDELLENLRTSVHLKERLDIPFLFLSCGKCCRIQRITGYMYGSSIVLSVPKYADITSRWQPTVRAMRAVLSNTNWSMYRDE